MDSQPAVILVYSSHLLLSTAAPTYSFKSTFASADKNFSLPVCVKLSIPELRTSGFDQLPVLLSCVSQNCFTVRSPTSFHKDRFN